MLGFFSRSNDEKSIVNSKEIYFVHIPSHLSKDEIKMSFAKKALIFAENFDLNKVFLHFGKEILEYDFKI